MNCLTKVKRRSSPKLLREEDRYVVSHSRGDHGRWSDQAIVLKHQESFPRNSRFENLKDHF